MESRVLSRVRLGMGFVLVGAMLLARSTNAQETGRFELGVFGGGSFGSRISLTPTGDVKIGIAPAWGLRGAFDLDRHFSLEASFSQAKPTATTDNPVTGARISEASITQSTYELSGLYRFGSGRVRGHFGLGMGAQTLNPYPGTTSSNTRFVANITMGTRIFLTDRLAFRVDGRYHWRATDDRISTVLCGMDGCKTFTTTLYSSAEVTGGLSYRFGNEPMQELTPSTGTAGEDPRRFGEAVGSLAIAELLPWSFNRYVSKAEFAHISTATVAANFTAGFGYDRDAFSTNQSSHPYHGNLFFNSARSNGYDFWESGAFALVGSFLWECCLEREPPAINDLVNTTLGGMTRGEILHRLSKMILDNTASGSTRLWQEIEAGVLNPMGGFNRLIRGDMTKDFPNPDDRFPSAFRFDADLGYRHVGNGAAHPDQGLVTLTIAYGDPFAGEINKPFDSFTFATDLGVPGDTLISRSEQRGILKGWELTEKTAPARHIFGVFMEYEYLNNQAQKFGAQMFSLGLLSRYTLSPDWIAITDLTGLVIPLAGLETTDVINPVSGRSFDYAPGGGLRAAGHLFYKGNSVLTGGYGIAWLHTADGSSTSNTLRFFRVTGRWALGKQFGVGAGYSWYSRHTNFAPPFEVTRTQNEWRAFLSWKLF